MHPEFPGTVDIAHFVRRTTELLAPFGFTGENAIACVGACRDELSDPFISEVVRAWGEAFNFSSLAGMLTLGRTGFAAARSHAPQLHDRERFVFISMPHIGVDRHGELGRVHRPGHTESSTACGALMALASEIRRGEIPRGIDPDDVEHSLLRERLTPLVHSTMEIAELTRVARRAILEDLERLIANADMDGVDYAVFSGVQIHTPDAELVWPADAYVCVDGERTDLTRAER